MGGIYGKEGGIEREKIDRVYKSGRREEERKKKEKRGK